MCAIVSHPADTLVSLLGKAENKGKSFGTIASEFGYGNLMVKGAVLDFCDYIICGSSIYHIMCSAR